MQEPQGHKATLHPVPISHRHDSWGTFGFGLRFVTKIHFKFSLAISSKM